MNPIRKWQRLRDIEIMEGGTPTICIMGRDDYASFCGAVSILVRGLPTYPVGDDYLFGNSREVIYEGIRLFKSMSKREGIMFA